MPPKANKQYVKMNPIDHILIRPDMYVGSTRPRIIDEFVVTDDKFNISKKSIKVSPAILRIFIEPLSNAIDNLARSRENDVKMTKISINIDKDTGETSIWNDGDTIPIEINQEEKCYNHTMIFGQLLTGSNYNDEEDRLDISGKNGLGAKAVCIFSKTFTVEGVDPVNKKIFRQTWTGNMKNVEQPVIGSTKEKRGYTKVTYIPDFSRFELDSYTDDIISLYKRYIVDTAMITKLNVSFNGEEIPVKNLLDYSRLYSGSESVESLQIKTSDCDVVITPSTDFQAISFANGICTSLGGTHVESWCEALFRPLIEKLNKKGKPQLNIADI
jgi:DNA topoisomerase-2